MANPKTDVEGISKEWDDHTELRERLRDGGSVLTSNPLAQDISTCTRNRGILDPLLTRMSVDPKRTVPNIDQLKDEIEELLKKSKRGVDAGGVDIPKTSWAIRNVVWIHKSKSPEKRGFNSSWFAS